MTRALSKFAVLIAMGCHTEQDSCAAYVSIERRCFAEKAKAAGMDPPTFDGHDEIDACRTFVNGNGGAKSLAGRWKRTVACAEYTDCAQFDRCIKASQAR